MLPVIWSHQAEADLLSIVSFIGERNARAADQLGEAIRSSTWPLLEHPYLFRRSQRVPNCREIVVHPNYVVVYHVGAESIRVLRVLHVRRQYP